MTYFKKKIFSLFLFLILSSFIFTYVVLANNNDGEDYFGYGDSIMRADTCSGDTDSCFVVKMVNTYDPTASKDHNTDGGGKSSWWGAGRGTVQGDGETGSFSANYDVGNDYFIFMFGSNDDNDIFYGWRTIAEHCDAMTDMYNWSSENGSKSYLLISPLKQNDTGGKPWNNYPDMTARMNALMDACEKYSIPYVKMFDAVDSVPYNGRIDYWSDENGYSWFCDHVHPNDAAHENMSDFLWFFINGDDLDKTYYETNDTMYLSAHYNQTININNTRYNWDTTNLSILCLSNHTEVNFDVRTSHNGSQMIQFSVEKDEDYEIKNKTIIINSVNDLSYGSITQDEVYKFNATFSLQEEDIACFKLELSNTSNMDSPFYSVIFFESDDNCWVNGSYVEYILPVEYRKSWNQYYYCQISVQYG